MNVEFFKEKRKKSNSMTSIGTAVVWYIVKGKKGKEKNA